MSSIRIISEQVMLRLKGGRTDQANRRDIREIDAAVRQAVNERYSGAYVSVTLPSGETIPEGLLLATFEDVPVTEWKNRSRAELPVIPVSLPKGVGVYEVTDPCNPDWVFIPTLPGQFHMVKDQDFLSDALPAVMYTPYGRNIEFSETLDCIKTVLMRLFVNDVFAESIDKDGNKKYNVDVFDLLAIPADWEAPIVDMVYKRFAPMLPTDNKTDVITENTGR